MNEGLDTTVGKENIILTPEEKEIKDAEEVLEQLKQKSEDMKVQIDQLMNDWKKNNEEGSLQVKKIEDLEKKQYYTEEYEINLEEFSKEMDVLISKLPNGEMRRYLSQNLKDQDLFLEICAKKNPQDFMILKEKRDKIDVLIKELK